MAIHEIPYYLGIPTIMINKTLILVNLQMKQDKSLVLPDAHDGCHDEDNNDID